MIVAALIALTLALDAWNRRLKHRIDRQRAGLEVEKGRQFPIFGRVLFPADVGAEAWVELGDGQTKGPLELQLDEIRGLPEASRR